MKISENLYAVMSLIQGDKILINEVRKFPYIYDQKHENYKDTKLKEETWNAIGAAINVNPGDAKNRWRNLRDRYTREKKMLITEGEDIYKRHEMWPYLEDMSFLWDLIVHRKRVQPREKNSVADQENDENYRSPNNNSYSNQNNYNNEEYDKKPVKKMKNDIKNLPALIPKPMQDWINSKCNINGLASLSNLNGISISTTVSNGYNGTYNNSNNTGVVSEEVIEVDPWACSINESSYGSQVDDKEDDYDMRPTQSKLRKLLCDQQEDSRDGSNSSNYEYGAPVEMSGQSKSSNGCQNLSYDEDQLFCLSVAASLKRYSPKVKAAIKIRMQQLLYEAEFQDDNSS